MRIQQFEGLAADNNDCNSNGILTDEDNDWPQYWNNIAHQHERTYDRCVSINHLGMALRAVTKNTRVRPTHSPLAEQARTTIHTKLGRRGMRIKNDAKK